MRNVGVKDFYLIMIIITNYKKDYKVAIEKGVVLVNTFGIYRDTLTSVASTI